MPEQEQRNYWHSTNYWHRGNDKKEASSNKFSFPRLIVVPLSIHLLVEYISRQQISSLFLFYSFIYGCKSWKCCTIIKPLSFWLLHKCHSRTDSSQSWVWWCTKGKGKVNRCSTLNSVWLSQRHRVMNYRKETNQQSVFVPPSFSFADCWLNAYKIMNSLPRSSMDCELTWKPAPRL